MRAAVRGIILAVALMGFLLGGAGAASAGSLWNVGLNPGGAAEAAAQALPAPPSPTATCAGLGGINVNWAAVTHAASYTVYRSTTSSTSGFSVVASDVTGLTYAQSGLGLGSYWFKVATTIGANWLGPMSVATNQRTITLVVCS